MRHGDGLAAGRRAKRGGRKRTVNVREDSSGCLVWSRARFKVPRIRGVLQAQKSGLAGAMPSQSLLLPIGIRRTATAS